MGLFICSFVEHDLVMRAVYHMSLWVKVWTLLLASLSH